MIWSLAAFLVVARTIVALASTVLYSGVSQESDYVLLPVGVAIEAVRPTGNQFHGSKQVDALLSVQIRSPRTSVTLSYQPVPFYANTCPSLQSFSWANAWQPDGY